MTAATITAERPAAQAGGRALPFIAAFMRFPLAMLGNLIWWIGLRAAGNPLPWQNAILWSNVHIVIVADVLSLAFIIWAVRREGASLRSLFVALGGMCCWACWCPSCWQYRCTPGALSACWW